jgi:hypothetical protein
MAASQLAINAIGQAAPQRALHMRVANRLERTTQRNTADHDETNSVDLRSRHVRETSFASVVRTG